MIHILQKFSLDELSMIQICKSNTRTGIISELLRMRDFSEPDIQKIIDGLLKKIDDYQDQQIEKIKEITI